MLNSAERKLVDQLLYDIEDVGEVASAVANLPTAQALFYFASQYNWDSGIAIPNVIANHPLCDRATALMLFWNAGAMDCLNATTAPTYQEEWFTFCKLITQRLLEGHYPEGPNSFDPNISKPHRYQYDKQGISPLLLDAAGNT